MTSRLVVKTIPIVRMDCPTCIPVLEREIKRLKGVKEVQGNYMYKTLKVTYDPQNTRLEDVEAAIERIGYQITYKKYPGVLSKIRRLFREEDEDIISIKDIDFIEKVLQAPIPVAVLFSSPSCPACQYFKRQYQEIAKQVKGKANIYEMDITTTETWHKYDILSIPTVLIFRGGQPSERFDALPKVEEVALSLGTKP